MVIERIKSKDRAVAVFVALVEGETLKSQSIKYGVSMERIRQIYHRGRQYVNNGLPHSETYMYGYDLQETRHNRDYWLAKAKLMSDHP